MRSLLLTISILAISLIAIGQNDIFKEEFQFSFSATKNGGQFLYNGKTHSFTIDILSDSIKTTEYSNYINVSNHIVQTSIVPLPSSNPNLNKLTTLQQKEALEGYISYELDYFKNDLKLNYQNFKKEWITVASRLWVIWSFDFSTQKANENVSRETKSQIYASTICFNQVLDLNTPLFQNDSFSKSKELINNLMVTLKLFDKRQ